MVLKQWWRREFSEYIVHSTLADPNPNLTLTLALTLTIFLTLTLTLTLNLNLTENNINEWENALKTQNKTTTLRNR